jgi:D-serine dehydratase
VVLAPHGKTTMMPELFRRQLAAGAWAMTVASPRQAEATVQAGADRILVANQPVDPVELRRLMAIAGSGHEVYVFADSVEGVLLLDQAAAASGAAVRVLVELGFEGGRTGVRTEDAFHEVLDAVGRAGRLELAGVSAFEGIIPSMRRRPPPPFDGIDPDRARCTGSWLAWGSASSGRRTPGI